MNQFLKIAHRGFNAKDNTVKSIYNAIKSGFDIIEVDVHKTLDNEIVLYHDSFINKYEIENTKSEQLMQEDSDLITIDILFDLFSPRKYSFMLDLKGTKEKNSVATLLILFLKNNNIFCDNLTISSFNQNYVREIASCFLSCKIAFTTANIFHPYCYTALVHNVHIIIVDISTISLELIDKLRIHRKKIYVYTCKNKIMYEYLKKLPIDGIISDIILD